MSGYGYTSAHFAATLLTCGPHKYHECISGAEGCPINRRYHDAVYSYFFELFPSMVPGSSEATSGRHEWLTFWREYLAWVES